jgi:hypothetical protein
MKPSKSPILTCLIVFAVLFLSSVVICGILGQIDDNARTKLVAECDFSNSRGKVRLYRIDGSSVTTLDWWRVTYQEDPWKEERTIYSAYGGPGLRNIECKEDQVMFIFYPNNPIPIPISWIKEKLVHNPLAFNRDRLMSLEYREEVSTWEDFNP